LLSLPPTTFRCPKAICLCAALAAASGAVPRSAAAQTVAQESTADTTAPSVSRENATSQNLFAATSGDFRRLFSKEAALILGIGGAAATLGHFDDRGLSTTMSGSPRLKGIFGPGELIGAARTQAAAAVATYAIGRMTSNATVTRVGADLIRAQIVTQTLTTVVKAGVRRTRPDGTQYSFPSGHTSVAFASATVLQRDLGWKAGVPAYAVASYVAASRIQAKRHFLSDVTFGAAIGIIAGRAVTIGHGDRRFALTPSAMPGGGAVTLTWTGRN
jgi:membrane-associated phospholipid phosphatase